MHRTIGVGLIDAQSLPNTTCLGDGGDQIGLTTSVPESSIRQREWLATESLHTKISRNPNWTCSEQLTDLQNALNTGALTQHEDDHAHAKA